MQPSKKQRLYQQLMSLPESLTGEILTGQLYANPRPGGKHILAASNIGADLHVAYQRGRGGPGGWWILQEPEVHFLLDEEVSVPDIAGWQRSRMPNIPDGHKFEIVPDWICEILSPSTEGIDREIKKPMYASFGVQYLWLIDPKRKILETFKLVDGDWEVQGHFSGNDKVCVEPFVQLELSLNHILE